MNLIKIIFLFLITTQSNLFAASIPSSTSSLSSSSSSSSSNCDTTTCNTFLSSTTPKSSNSRILLPTSNNGSISSKDLIAFLSSSTSTTSTNPTSSTITSSSSAAISSTSSSTPTPPVPSSKDEEIAVLRQKLESMEKTLALLVTKFLNEKESSVRSKPEACESLMTNNAASTDQFRTKSNNKSEENDESAGTTQLVVLKDKTLVEKTETKESRPIKEECKEERNERTSTVTSPSAKPTAENRFEGRIINIKVKSQNDSDGGGPASCGYHAIKNGFFIIKGLSEDSKVRETRIATFVNDNGLIANLFGRNEARWRRFIIKNRNTRIISQWIYNRLLSSVHGAQVTAIPGGISKSLNLNQGQIYFDQYKPKAVIIPVYSHSNKDRETLMNLLTDVSVRCAEILEYDGNTRRLLFHTLGIILNGMIRKKRPTHIEKYINFENKLIRYLPNINEIDFQINNGIISMLVGSESAYRVGDTLDFTNYGYRADISDIALPKMTGMLGEWLDANEINELVNSEKGSTLLQKLHIDLDDVPIAIIHDRDTLANQRPFNENLQEIITDIRDTSKDSLAMLLININGNHWISGIIQKRAGQLPNYYFADSLGVFDCLTNARILAFLRFIENHTEEISIGDITTELVEPLKGKKEEDIPTLEALFNNKIPANLVTLLARIRNKDHLDKNGLMFYGPPGTGKTTAAFLVARLMNRKVLYRSGGDFLTKYQGSGAESFNELFKELNKLNKPMVLFIDEAEGACKEVSSQATGDESRMTAALLAQLNKCLDNPNIFVIIASNHLKIIAGALKDRFLSISMPIFDYASRWGVIINLLKKYNIPYPTSGQNGVNSGFLDKFHVATEDFTYRDLNEIISNAKYSFDHNLNVAKKPSFSFRFKNKFDYKNNFFLSAGHTVTLAAVPLIGAAMGGGSSESMEWHIYAHYELIKQRIDDSKKTS